MDAACSKPLLVPLAGTRLLEIVLCCFATLGIITTIPGVLIRASATHAAPPRLGGVALPLRRDSFRWVRPTIGFCLCIRYLEGALDGLRLYDVLIGLTRIPEPGFTWEGSSFIPVFAQPVYSPCATRSESGLRKAKRDTSEGKRTMLGP